MASDDDISARVLEGDSYELAAMTTRRTFAISLRRKIHLGLSVLAGSILLGPTLLVRREFIRSLEGAGSLSATLELSIGLMALLGVLTTFLAGAVLAGYRYRTQQRSLSPERARRMVRTEDVLMWVLLQGTAFVLIPLVLSLLGLLVPDVIVTLYGNGVGVYRTTPLAPDALSISVLGGLLALILAAIWGAVIGHAGG